MTPDDVAHVRIGVAARQDDLVGMLSRRRAVIQEHRGVSGTDTRACHDGRHSADEQRTSEREREPANKITHGVLVAHASLKIWGRGGNSRGLRVMRTTVRA